MRRLLNQAANSAAKTKGSIFEIVSTDLAHPASGSSLRRTGPSRHQAVKAKAHYENDPATPKARLPDRIAVPSAQPSTRAVIFDSGYWLI
jgi:hypothetical protein